MKPALRKEAMRESRSAANSYFNRLDSLRGSSPKLGTIQIILAWPLRKDEMHKSRSVSKYPRIPQRRLQTREETPRKISNINSSLQALTEGNCDGFVSSWVDLFFVQEQNYKDKIKKTVHTQTNSKEETQCACLFGSPLVFRTSRLLPSTLKQTSFASKPSKPSSKPSRPPKPSKPSKLSKPYP